MRGLAPVTLTSAVRFSSLATGSMLGPLCSTDAKMCLSAASLPCFPAQGVQLSCQVLKAPQSPQQHFNLMQNLRPLLSTNTPLAKGERELILLPPASLS